MDDGSEEEIRVSDNVYAMAMEGEVLDVCHSESPLGMVMLKIHPPETEERKENTSSAGLRFAGGTEQIRTVPEG